MDSLKTLYYDKKQGLLSEDKLYKKARKAGIPVTHKLVKEFLSKQVVSQVFHERKIKDYFPLQSQYPFERVQIDLLDMSNQSVRGFKWVFCCVDVYTRYAFCKAIKNKTKGESLKAFKEILDEITTANGFSPRRVDSDKESAFLSKSFQKLLADYGIEHHTSETDDKRGTAVVERFNRTLRAMFEKIKVAYNDRDWVKALPDLLENYNNTDHKSLGTTPMDAIENNDKYEEKVEHQTDKARQRLYNRDSIEVGTLVRLKIRKGLFEKDSQKWTKSTHTVSEVQGKDYYISDRVEPYRKQELLRVDETAQTPAVDIAKEKEDDQKEADQKVERRITRRMNMEGVHKKAESTEEEKNDRALRSYRRPRDMGPYLI